MANPEWTDPIDWESVPPDLKVQPGTVVRWRARDHDRCPQCGDPVLAAGCFCSFECIKEAQAASSLTRYGR